MFKVELVYIALDKTAVNVTMELPEGSTVGYALNKAKIHETHPETAALSVGIFAKVVSLDTVLREGDRIELYRPLALDPKEKRRQLARRRMT